jgi:hypothetical protein
MKLTEKATQKAKKLANSGKTEGRKCSIKKKTAKCVSPAAAATPKNQNPELIADLNLCPFLSAAGK